MVRKVLFPSVLAIVLVFSTSSFADQAIPREIEDRLIRGVSLIITPNESGTGALIDRSRGLILTNYHVVTEEKHASVVFPAYRNGQRINLRDWYWKNWRTLAVRGEVVHRDKTRDLALIRVKNLPTWAQALPLAEKRAAVDDVLFRTGSPAVKGEGWVTKTGKVESVRTLKANYDKSKQNVDAMVVISNMPSLPGTSGGGVVNAQGKLVAIHAMGSVDDKPQSHGIDLAEVKFFLRDSGTLPAKAGDIAGTDWQGEENLKNYGALRFRFLDDKKVDMTDRDGSTKGTYRREGEEIVMAFQRDTIVYRGVCNGNTLSGQATAGDAKWQFTVKRAVR
jgi:hypothetical protein